MEAYKFEAVVQKDGIIKIPEIALLANTSVEVFIIAKQDEKLDQDSQAKAIANFLEKWRGFLSGVNPDDAKLQYLLEKHQ